MQPTPRHPYLYLASGVIAVSFAAIFIKLSSAPALVIAAYRLLFASLCLSPVVLLCHRRELATIQRRDLGLMLLSGCFLALHFATWISSFQYTTVASSTVLVSSQPLFVVGLSYLLYRETITRRQALGVAATIAGSVIIGLADAAGGSSGASLYGDLLALLGAVFAALYFLCGRTVRQRVSVLPYSLGAYASSALVLLTICWLSGTPLAGYPGREYLLLLGLALVCSVIGHSALNWALGWLPTSAVGVSVLGEPIGATIWAALLFHEIPTVGQISGGIILLLGILTFLLAPATPAEPGRPPASREMKPYLHSISSTDYPSIAGAAA